ncbi:MAG: acetylornithine deacetylase [Gammaproteobacteria bacterium]
MHDLSAELRILETLVGFDTTSRSSNLALIEWVRGYAASLGLHAEAVQNADGSKANLLLHAGPEVPGGIVLSGHTDVVPVDGQAWTSAPWELTSRDGRYYGRGTADMKGFIALALASLQSLDVRLLTKPLIIALSHDEEVGCLGAPALIELLQKRFPAPAAVIVGEPTSMRVVVAHKGMRVFSVEVTGKEAHSSSVGLGIGVSAIETAVELMARIGQWNAEAAAGANPDSAFRPRGTTLTVGKVEGGTAANILARRCRFMWDLRAEREADADELEARFRTIAAQADARLRSMHPDCGVRIQRLASAPPLEADPAQPARALARELTGDHGCGCVPFVAEAGLFQRAGLPAVLCGPGSIDQAHQPDEWIAHEQLVAGRRFIRDVIARLRR